MAKRKVRLIREDGVVQTYYVGSDEPTLAPSLPGGLQRLTKNPDQETKSVQDGWARYQAHSDSKLDDDAKYEEMSRQASLYHQHREAAINRVLQLPHDQQPEPFTDEELHQLRAQRGPSLYDRLYAPQTHSREQQSAAIVGAALLLQDESMARNPNRVAPKTAHEIADSFRFPRP